jgi:hypothetical protein
MASDLLNAVRNLYSRDEIWSKTGQRLVRGMFKPRIRWEISFKQFMDEFRDVEKHYRSVSPTGEPIEVFAVRLVDRLALGKLIEHYEASILKQVIAGGEVILQLRSEEAKAILLRACFEIGRKRPELPKNLRSLEMLLLHVVTTDNLISYPLSMSLPLSTQEEWYTPTALNAADRLECQSVPDYHIVLALQFGDYEYAEAVSELAKRFLSLDEAFEILLNTMPPIETSRGHFAHPFIERFKSYCEQIR